VTKLRVRFLEYLRRKKRGTPPRVSPFYNRIVHDGLNMRRWRKTGELQNGKVKTICSQCGKTFERYASQRPNATFCSNKCSGASKKNRIMIVCKSCGRQFERMVSQVGTYCSLSCAARGNVGLRGASRIRPKGSKHWNWAGGITPKNKADRQGFDYSYWRKRVFERDGYKCTVCGSDKPKLHVHHILEFAQYPDRRFDVDNGVTFCVKHHQMLHPGVLLADFRKYYINRMDSSILGPGSWIPKNGSQRQNCQEFVLETTGR